MAKKKAGELAFRRAEAAAAMKGIALTREDFCVAAHTAIRVIEWLQPAMPWKWLGQVAANWVLKELREWREENDCGVSSEPEDPKIPEIPKPV